MNFYISDMHWGQADVITYDQRPFTDAEDCYCYMKEEWNQVVAPEDHVYIVGDCLSMAVENMHHYLSGLNGHLHLVIGNHDANLIQHPEVGRYFEEIEQIVEVMDGDTIVVMCHYPMLCWLHRNNKNCVHIFGHVHGNCREEIQYINKNGVAYNAGCMVNHYRPVTLQELKKNNIAFLLNG